MRPCLRILVSWNMFQEHVSVRSGGESCWYCQWQWPQSRLSAITGNAPGPRDQVGRDSSGSVSDWSRSQIEHSDWSRSRAWQVLPISTRCGMLGEVLARSAPAYVGQIAAIFHNKNEKGFKLLNNWKFGFSVRLAWFSGIHISYSFSNGLDAKKLQMYWMSDLYTFLRIKPT